MVPRWERLTSRKGWAPATGEDRDIFRMRCLELLDSQNFGLESSVGLYIDGIYRARQNAMINDMIDLEAVEILRGP